MEGMKFILMVFVCLADPTAGSRGMKSLKSLQPPSRTLRASFGDSEACRKHHANICELRALYCLRKHPYKKCLRYYMETGLEGHSLCCVCMNDALNFLL